MALKDTWVDKIDDVDDVLAEDINAIAKQAIDNADAILEIVEGVPIVHADTDAYGDYFVEAIEGIEDPLKIPLGTTICFVPGATSQSTQVRLGIGGTKDSPLVYYSIRRYLSIGTLRNAYGATEDWLAINNPYIMSFNGGYWVVHGLTKPSAADLHSQVPVANGGTGAATPEEARANLGVVQGVPIVNATSTDGITYIATDDSIAELKMGTFITFITDKTSTTVDVVLNLNGFGVKEIKRSTSDGQQYAEISNPKWLTADIPYTLMYDGAYWVAADLPQPRLSDVSGLLSIEHGGTGGSTAEIARKNLGAAATAELDDLDKRTKQLQYYGDADIEPTDKSLFVYEINDDGESCTIIGFTGTDIENIVIPYEYGELLVTSIGGSAFSLCSSLTSVTIGNNVTKIGGTAFLGCDNLTSVTIGNGVTNIVTFAFRGCSSLASVTLGNNVTSIDDYAFYQCPNLKKVYYEGTPAEWAAITIGEYNGSLPNAEIRYGAFEVDDEPIEGSVNLITSGAVYNALGDIETALDSILAMQNELIGGDSV